MKKILLFLGAIAIITSCNKEGPAGPAGQNGQNGTNAAVNCSECHNSNNNKSDISILASQDEYVFSGHYLIWQNTYPNGLSGEWQGAGCARCHTNEGFNEAINNGSLNSQNIATAILNPTPQSCYTCHDIHMKYDSTDLKLKTTGPVTALMDGATIINFSGTTAGVTGSGGWLGSNSYGNLCAMCHQALPLTTASVEDMNTKATLTAASNPNDSVYIYSSHYGPHDGPQSILLAGVALFPISGPQPYTNFAHTSAPNGCISCHMGSPVGLIGGGHALNVGYTTPMAFPFSTSASGASIDANGCIQCHGTSASSSSMLALIIKSQATTQGYMTTLSTTLVNNNWITAGGSVNASATSPLKVKAFQAEVIYDYLLVLNDKSIGVHNPTYAQALLQNCIAALQQ